MWVRFPLCTLAYGEGYVALAGSTLLAKHCQADQQRAGIQVLLFGDLLLVGYFLLTAFLWYAVSKETHK